MRAKARFDRTVVIVVMALFLIGLIGTLTGSVAMASTISYTGVETTYTITSDGTYFILAGGAQGGSGEQNPGGAGTEIEGSAFLTAGTQIDIVVGGQGLTGDFGSIWGGGGGGGTFAWIAGSTTPLLIAGGGGGAGYDGDGGIAATFYNTNGLSGSGVGGGAGGTAGQGGAGGTGDGGSYNGGGGGGWLSAGGNGLGGGPLAGTGGSGNGGGEISPFAGGLGGGDDSEAGPFANGGFGGGGGGGWQGGGGGGGYSGGGGGDGLNPGFPGGAGGSYLDASLNGAGFLSGGNLGDGFLDINTTSIPIGGVPEPGTMALVLVGLSAVGIIRRRRKA